MVKEDRTLANLDDNILVDLALLEKNQKAWTELINRYYGKVASTVYRIIGKSAEAEDIVQEVFTEMAKSIKLYRRDSLFSTFLYRIAVNTTYKYIQKNMDRNETAEEPEFFIQIGDKSSGSESSLIKQDRARMLNSAMRKISPEKRLVLTLYEVEGVPLKEISEILKQPLQTIWSRINQAKKELYEILNPSM
ncbi:RNA polymerase sigma factor [bacterium]|nr:RNA polymerase sigma factor [bacterium]